MTMDPDMRTFTITMPAVAVFLLGTALCCYCCFKYGLEGWYERTLEKARTQSRTGITYAASLQYKKEQLEHALQKVTKLRQAEPTRADLKYEAVALQEGLRMLHEHLHNSERYADYCAQQKRPSVISPLSVDAHGNPQPAISSSDPWTVGSSPTGSYSPTGSSDEECHNPKHRKLELYLMSTGGTILPSMLAYPAAGPVGAPRWGSPPSPAGGGSSLNASPASPDAPPPPSPVSPPRMPLNWQQQRSPIQGNNTFTPNQRMDV